MCEVVYENSVEEEFANFQAEKCSLIDELLKQLNSVIGASSNAGATTRRREAAARRVFNAVSSTFNPEKSTRRKTRSGVEEKAFREAIRELFLRQEKANSPSKEDNCDHLTVGRNTDGFNTSYIVKDLQPHEFPVIGTYIDTRIVTGFWYKIRICGRSRPHYQFGGASMQLSQVGMGYGKRLTFSSRSLNSNNNFFWTDTHPDGYAFSIQAIFPGQRFQFSQTSDQTGSPPRFLKMIEVDTQEEFENADFSHTDVDCKLVEVSGTCIVEEYGDAMCFRGVAKVVRHSESLVTASKLIKVAHLPGFGPVTLYSCQQ